MTVSGNHTVVYGFIFQVRISESRKLKPIFGELGDTGTPRPEYHKASGPSQYTDSDMCGWCAIRGLDQNLLAGRSASIVVLNELCFSKQVKYIILLDTAQGNILKAAFGISIRSSCHTTPLLDGLEIHKIHTL